MTRAPRRTVGALVIALVCSVLVVGQATSPASAAVPLTNFAHLNFLGTTVTPPTQANHTTYQPDRPLGVLWTYADRRDDGHYELIGGGTRDPQTNTWSQGAFNADDVTRAAVVYLRHWQQTGDPTSRNKAFDLLRAVAYFQTSTGPNAGNVVLWMQPDGTLNPSPLVKELPDPSDSAESYWLARTVWALGEGYAAFRGSDPAFAGFLEDRLDLSVSALQRQTLARYGQFRNIDGEQTPAWLVVDGGDATAEAVLGLSAYVRTGSATSEARDALVKLAAGVAALGGGDARSWPFGAVRPWALSRSIWHGWGSQMPAALARSSVALGDSSLAVVATRDSAVFDPWMLTSGGPDNGRLPTRIDGSQITYGVDSRLQSLLATADVTRSAGLRRLAGVMAAWYFGANASGRPAYDPATGRSVDGIQANGDVNHNAGAESTIHGLLSMLALDANPDVAELARTAGVQERVGNRTVQVEGAQLAGGAHVVKPQGGGWTEESYYEGDAYAALPAGGSARVTVGKGEKRLVIAVVDLQPGSTAVTTFRAGDTVLGTVRSGDIGPQGDSPAPGALLPVTLPVTLPPGQRVVTATTTATGGDEARLDALMVEPLVSRLVLGGDGHGTALLRSAATTDQHRKVSVPGSGPARIEIYDGRGRLVRASTSKASGDVPVSVVAGGFTIVRR
ncbi:MAG: hypothetical protein ABJA93_03745 [Sporichthyaceae bacterium]